MQMRKKQGDRREKEIVYIMLQRPVTGQHEFHISHEFRKHFLISDYFSYYLMFQEALSFFIRM